MADTRDLKSLAKYLAYGFESRLRHFLIRLVSSAHTANFCLSFPPPSGIYRPLCLTILPDSLWHTSRFDLP